LRAVNAPSQISFENGVVNGWKIPEDIAPQNMGIPVTVLFVSRNSPVRAFMATVGVAVVDKAPLKNRLDHRANSMMDHPVTKGCGGYAPRLWLADVYHHVAPRVPGAVVERTLEPQNFRFQMRQKSRSARFFSFAPCSTFGGRQERLKAGDMAEQVVNFAWHGGF
jgi:hypothetical protein